MDASPPEELPPWHELQASNWEFQLEATGASSFHDLPRDEGTFATPLSDPNNLPPLRTPYRLIGVRSKIEWAKQHILQLKAAIRRFLDSDPYEVGTKRDPDTRRVLHYLTHVKPVPLEISLMVGDVIHNLRSALDHLAWQLVLANASVPTKTTAYPIMEDRAKYMAKDPRVVKGMRPAAVNLIDATQPYGGGNDQLWAIHNLDRIDKHRLMLVVGSANRSVNIAPLMWDLMEQSVGRMFGPIVKFPRPDLFLLNADRVCPLDAGDVLFTDLPDAKLDKKFDFRFDVAFGDPGILKGKPVGESLQQLADLVDSLIGPFVPLL